ncbi:hypothetical protein F5I97DRAFT_998827 [Phlebopus sp. FC_14]|nr:hypothetical protein F5I97DRAFT_998827 [Phlebopus sp. FC_14]
MYFMINPTDALLVKGLVIANLLLCAADIVALSSVIYTDLVVHFGNVVTLNVSGWGSHAEPLLTTLIAFLIQSFFLYRVFRLTKNWIVVVVSAPFILLTLGLGLATVGRIFNSPTALSDTAERRVLHANDIFLMVTDILLAALMAYSLYQSKSASGVESTHKVISTLIAYSIATGALTGATAMIGFILVVADSASTANQAVYAIVPHMYSNAMLATLNLRQIITKPWRSGNAVELSTMRINSDRSQSEVAQTTSTARNSKVSMSPEVWPIYPG